VRVGIIGAGHVGGNVAQFLTGAGHDVTVSFSRDPGALGRLAAELGARASAGTPAEAVSAGEVVVISVPWPIIGQALNQAGSLAGKVIIDTCNQFGPGARQIPAGQTAAQFNQARMPGARYTKSFNTLTAGFQRQAAARTGESRVVQWLCGDDAEAKTVAAGLITDAGFVPVDLGGTADAAVMECPAGLARSTARSTASVTPRRWPRPSGRADRSRPYPATRSPDQEADMRAVTVSAYGAAPAVIDLPDPEPGPGQLLIKVGAAGVNPMDRSIAGGQWQAMMPASVRREISRLL